MYWERTTRVDNRPPRVDGIVSIGAPPHLTTTAKSHQIWRPTFAGTLTMSLAVPGATPPTPTRDGSTVAFPPALSRRTRRDLRILTTLRKVTMGQTTRGVWLSRLLE